MEIAVSIFITLIICVIAFNLKSPGKRIEHRILPKGDIDSETVIRSIGQLLGPPIVGGNKLTMLHNGDMIFPEMLKAISSANRTITFETFIYWSGEIGQRFAEALSERARSGVRVHVLLDWVGSRSFEEAAMQRMKDAGVILERYRPLRWYNLSRVNNRTHRKILIVDGKIGFTGGVGIADQWQGQAQDPKHWRDSHFKIEGPVVAQLQAAFSDNWNASHPEVLHGDEYFPEIAPAGNALGQVFKSSPEEGSGSVRLMYLYSIAHAKTSIHIANSYFVPDSHVRKLLIEAAQRGVEIQVIVPGAHIDTAITRDASRSVWGEILQAGIRIYEYQPTMFHCKYMVVDEAWISVGSTNMDNRSFRLNDECNLNLIDREYAKEMISVFQKDLKSSREVTYSDWKNRPKLVRLKEWVASMFHSQL